MPRYKKQAQFPQPFIPGPFDVTIKDPFGSTLSPSGGGGPEMAGVGGGTVVTGGVTIEMVRQLIGEALPRNAWKIMVSNNYDYTDPDVPVYVSSSATIWGGSVVYAGYNSFSTLISVGSVGATFTPVNGFFLYIAGTVNSSQVITGLTLTQASALPARMVFSGSVQSDFIVPIGKYVQLGDGSFVADQWQHGQLTAVSICVVDGGISKPARYLF